MWLNLLYSFVAMIVSSALTSLLAPKPEAPVAGQLDVPTAREGDSVMVMFGTNIIKQSNVIWYGHPFTKDIKSKGGKK